MSLPIKTESSALSSTMTTTTTTTSRQQQQQQQQTITGSKLSLRKRRREKKRLSSNPNVEDGDTCTRSKSSAKKRKRSRGPIPLPTFTFFSDCDDDDDEEEEEEEEKEKIESIRFSSSTTIPSSKHHEIEKENVACMALSNNNCSTNKVSNDDNEKNDIEAMAKKQRNNELSPKELPTSMHEKYFEPSNNESKRDTHTLFHGQEQERNSSSRPSLNAKVNNSSSSKTDEASNIFTKAESKSIGTSGMKTIKMDIETSKIYSKKIVKNVKDDALKTTINKSSKTISSRSSMVKTLLHNDSKESSIKAKPKLASRSNRRTQTKSSAKLNPIKESPVDNDVVCLMPSPPDDIKDFHISKAQLLADEEKKLERAHEDLMEQAKAAKIITTSKSQPIKKAGAITTQVQSTIQTCLLPTSSSCISQTTTNKILNSLENKAIQEDKNPLYQNPHLTTSDSEIERAMISRLGRLEKSASYFNHLCVKVSKELKKHRNKMNKDRIKRNEDASLGRDENSSKGRFLNDIHEDAVFHQENQFSSNKFPHSMVRKAVNKMYAFRKKCQPTLTQMLDNDDDDSFNGSVQGETNTDDFAMDIENDEQTDRTNSNEEPENDKDIIDNGKNENNFESGTYIDYEIAWSKGKERGLWGLSTVTPTIFSNMKDIFSKEDIMNLNDENDWLNKEWSSHNSNDLEELVEMFLNEVNNSNDKEEIGDCDYESDQNHKEAVDLPSEKSPSTTFKQQSNLMDLSPRRQDACRSIKESVQNNKDIANSIQAICPSWEENITFAFQQHPKENKVALANIQEMQLKLHKVRNLILENLKSRQAVLQLFETALSQSLSMQSEKL